MDAYGHLIGLLIVSIGSALTVAGLNFLLNASWVAAFAFWAFSVAAAALFFTPVGRAR